MKIRKKIRSIAVILFTVILTLNSVSAEASGLRITKELDESDFITPSDDEILEHIGGGASEPARPMKDESPTHAYREKRTQIKAATCTSTGQDRISCANPGCSIHPSRVETTPKLGHNLRYEYTAPTESSTGWEGYKCTRCSYKNGTTIPRLAHDEKPDKPSTPSDPKPGSGSGSGGGNNSGSGSGNQGGNGSGNQGGNGGNNNSGQGTGNTSQTTQKTSTKATQLEATNVTTTSGGDPVDLFTGAHEIDFVVLSQSGVSDITVALSYKSNKSIDGVFGKGFYWNYESFLKEENGRILLYHSPCEFVEYEKKDGTSVYVTKAKGSKLDELNKNADGSFTLKSNEKVFDYNKEGKLVKVTQKTKESVSIEYKNKETVLHDDLSGQTISLLFNDKGQVVKVTNNATAEATFEYNDKGYLTKYTDADGFVTEYTFDEAGRVLTGKDADGNVFFTDFYDEKGRVKEQKDALGNLSTFEYKEIESAAQDKTNVIVKETILKDREGNAEVSSFDEAGRLLKTVDEEGNISLKEYDKEGNLIKSTDALGNVTLSEYDEKDNLIKSVDALGNETKYEYDENRNVTKITFPDGTENTFTYDKSNRLLSSTNQRGLVTKNAYYKNGLLKTSRTGNQRITYTYENGEIKTIEDSFGNVTTFDYDENGHLVNTVDALLAQTKLSVSPFGAVTATTDAYGNTKSFTLSPFDKPIKVTDEDGNVATNEYDERQLLKASIDNKGNRTEFFYDKEERLVKTVFPDGTFTESEYDKTGKLLSTTDALGNKTSFSYDANGNVVKETDKEGNETTFTYNAKGQVLTKTDSKGNVTSFTYDSMGRKVTETNALGGVTKYSYNTAGDLVSIEDALGNVTSFTYDEYGRKVSETDPNGNTTTFKYDLNGNLIETTNALGETTAYKYDSLNRLVGTYVGGKADLTIEETGEESFEPEPETEIEETQVASKDIVHVHKGTDKTLSANGCYTSSYQSREVLGYKDEWDGYSYYSCWNNDGGPNCQQCGQPISAGGRHKLYEPTPQYGYRTRYTCNHTNEKTGNVSISLGEDGLKAYVLYPDGSECHVDAYSWKLDNKEVDKDEICEITSSGTYELSLNLNDKYSGANQTVSLSYEVTGELFNELKKKKESSEVAYSFSARNVYDLSKAHGVEIAYDLNGRVVSETDPNGNTTRKVYDKRGNVSKVIDALGYETSYVYDKNGNLVSSTNAKGQTISYEINSKNLVTKITDALNLESIISYDNNGRLKSVVNPMGGVSENIFDKKGNILELVGPNGAKTDFTYDSNDNLTSRSTVAGNSVKYTYNALNLAESMTNGRGQNFTYEYDLLGRITKSISPEGETTYSYDKNSNVLTVTDLNGTITRTYDSLNRVSSVTDTYGNTVSYVYDSYGNLARLIYPDNTAVSYTYDSLGNIKTVTDWEGRVTSYNYDSINREIECFNANGTKTEKGHDEVGNVIRLAEYKDHAGTTLTAETILEYDQGNRLVKETETVKGIAYEYSYDDLSRVLLRKTINTKTGAVTDEETFGYDPAGNIVNSTGIEAKKALSYIAEDNRLDLADGVKFTFDNDGNLISGKLFDKDTTLTYDSKNRLTGFNDDSYVYDAEDYRIQSIENARVEGDNNDPDSQTGEKNNDENKENDTPEPQEEIRVDLLAEYYQQFKVTSGDGIVESNLSVKANRINATIIAKEDDAGNWQTGELSSGIIDVSKYAYIEMKACNAMVYLDDELVFDGRAGLSVKQIEKRFDVSGKNKLEIKSICPKESKYYIGQWLRYQCPFSLSILSAGTSIKPKEEETPHTEDDDGTESSSGSIDEELKEELQEEPEELLQPINLLAECYENFTLGWGGTWSGNYRAKFITKNTSKVEALLQGLSDHDGDGYGTMSSGDIDISGHKYLDITTCNCAVYIDGALLYDYTGQKTNGLVISKRIDITGKSKLKITANSWYSWDYRSIVASVTELTLDDPVTDIDYSDLLALNYDRFSLGWGGSWSGNVKRKFRSQSEKKVEAELGGLEDHDGYGYATLSSGNIDIAGWDYLDVETMNCAVYIDGVLQYDYSRYNTNNQVVSKRIDIKGKSTLLITSNSGYSRSYRVITASVTKIQLGKEISQASFGANIQESDGIFTVSNISSIDVSGGENNSETDETIASQENGSDDTIVEEENVPDVTGNELSENPDTEGQVSSNELEITDISSNEIALLDVSSNDATEIDVSENEIEEIQAPDEEPRTETIRYCYDRIDKDLLTAISDTGRIVKYVYGNGLISSYTEETDSEGSKTSSFESYSYDLRGSVTRVTDEAGNVKTEYAYSTYGKRTVIFGDQNHFAVLGYCARDGVLTDLNGLIYMRARYYSTELMRFINQDIVVGDISNSNSLNRYTYVEGNPATLIDPFGLDPSRFENAALGSYNLFKGSAMMGIGASAMKLGVIVAAAGGPVGWILGGGLFIVGGISIIFGYSDVCEGGQQIANAVCDTNYHTTNLVRDYCFAGDQVAYESVEFMLPSLAYGMGTIGSAYVSSRQAPTTSISQAAGYDNSQTSKNLSDNEVYYRTMSQENYDYLRLTGEVPSTGETFISPTEAYSSNYNGVTVEFQLNGGTTDLLRDIGVSNNTTQSVMDYGLMPDVKNATDWTTNNAFFKGEGVQTNIGLGKGKALEIFNSNIVGYNAIGGKSGF